MKKFLSLLVCMLASTVLHASFKMPVGKTKLFSPGGTGKNISIQRKKKNAQEAGQKKDGERKFRKHMANRRELRKKKLGKKGKTFAQLVIKCQSGEAQLSDLENYFEQGGRDDIDSACTDNGENLCQWLCGRIKAEDNADRCYDILAIAAPYQENMESALGNLIVSCVLNNVSIERLKKYYELVENPPNEIVLPNGEKLGAWLDSQATSDDKKMRENAEEVREAILVANAKILSQQGQILGKKYPNDADSIGRRIRHEALVAKANSPKKDGPGGNFEPRGKITGSFFEGKKIEAKNEKKEVGKQIPKIEMLLEKWFSFTPESTVDEVQKFLEEEAFIISEVQHVKRFCAEEIKSKCNEQGENLLEQLLRLGLSKESDLYNFLEKEIGKKMVVKDNEEDFLNDPEYLALFAPEASEENTSEKDHKGDIRAFKKGDYDQRDLDKERLEKNKDFKDLVVGCESGKSPLSDLEDYFAQGGREDIDVVPSPVMNKSLRQWLWEKANENDNANRRYDILAIAAPYQRDKEWAFANLICSCIHNNVPVRRLVNYYAVVKKGDVDKMPANDGQTLAWWIDTQINSDVATIKQRAEAVFKVVEGYRTVHNRAWPKNNWITPNINDTDDALGDLILECVQSGVRLPELKAYLAVKEIDIDTIPYGFFNCSLGVFLKGLDEGYYPHKQKVLDLLIPMRSKQLSLKDARNVQERFDDIFRIERGTLGKSATLKKKNRLPIPKFPKKDEEIQQSSGWNKLILAGFVSFAAYIAYNHFADQHDEKTDAKVK